MAACSAGDDKGGVRGQNRVPNNNLPSTNPMQPSGMPIEGGSSTTIGGSGGSGSAGNAGMDGNTVGDVHGCTGSSVTAPPADNPKVDIIWVVDASGSMLDEQMKIGMNLTKFADDITSANLDVHIVMMTTSAAIPVICPVTSPDPLAGTALAGDPRYMFIDSGVDSHNLLDVAVASYSQYQNFLRADAATHFVMVTDDESTYAGLGTAQERADKFNTDMTALLMRSFFLHTISSPGPTACSDDMCMPDENSGLCVFAMLGCGAAAPGETYYDLASATGGLTASICEHDWANIFDPLTEAVIASAPLPCNFPIPAPPTGQSLNPDKVGVGWLQPGTTDQQLFGRSDDAAACGDKLGWYYDDAKTPTQVLLCPATCSKVAAGGTIQIAFSCAQFAPE
jgi:hypothetical protein